MHVSLNNNNKRAPVTPNSNPLILNIVSRSLKTIIVNNITAIGLLTMIMAELMGFVRLSP